MSDVELTWDLVIAEAKARPDDEVAKVMLDVQAQLARYKWIPVSEAPKGGGAELVTDPEYIKPPKILLLFEGGVVSVGYWDAYYAEGGRGYEGGEAWIEPVSGERLDLNYDAPIGWMPLPSPPLQGDSNET
jgi:hypothetical protein